MPEERDGCFGRFFLASCLKPELLFLIGFFFHGRSGLLGNYQVLDFVVSSLRDNLFANEVGLFGIGAAVDYFLGVEGSNARQSVELILGGRVDIDEIARRSSGSGFGSGLSVRLRRGLMGGNGNGKTEQH